MKKAVRDNIEGSIVEEEKSSLTKSPNKDEHEEEVEIPLEEDIYSGIYNRPTRRRRLDEDGSETDFRTSLAWELNDRTYLSPPLSEKDENDIALFK